MADRDVFADILEQARLHGEIYSTALRTGNESGENARKLAKLLTRLDHVVALWDADDPMGAYQVLTAAIRDARER